MSYTLIQVRGNFGLDGSAAVPPPVAKQAEGTHRATNGGSTAQCQAHPKPWEWVEPSVWTDRMLAALQHGVKGGKWFSLMDKVAAERTLALVWERVKRKKGSPGVDRQSIAMFDAHEAEAALGIIQRWVTANGLCLHMENTRFVDARERGGFEFLGYHFERGMRWPRRRSELQFREAIRAKTGRTSGDSMVTIVKTINPIIRGWYEYYKHSHKATFPPKDAWVRMRLRSILRHRHKGKGRGRGLDHRRWPNSYFAGRGLFTMSTARDSVRQSR
jgi:hypothetical protein